MFTLYFYVSGDHRDLHLSLHDALPISVDHEDRPPRRLADPAAELIDIVGIGGVDLDGRDVVVAIEIGLRLGHRHEDEHRSEEHTSELQSLTNLVCRLLLEKKKQ